MPIFREREERSVFGSHRQNRDTAGDNDAARGEVELFMFLRWLPFDLEGAVPYLLSFR